MAPQIQWGHDLIFWAHVKSSVTWPFDPQGPSFHEWSIVTMPLSRTVTDIWRLKSNGVTSLTFWGHVTSWVTWPFDSRLPSFYGWSIVAMLLSGIVTEIWRLKYNQVTSLTFWSHVTSSVTWPFDSLGPSFHGWFIVTMLLSGTVTDIWCLKGNGVTSLIFWVHVTSSVTWPFDSRKPTHSSHGPLIRNHLCRVQWSHELWPHVTLNGQTCDPKIFEALYLCLCMIDTWSWLITNKKVLTPSPMLTWPMTSQDPKRSTSWPQ